MLPIIPDFKLILDVIRETGFFISVIALLSMLSMYLAGKYKIDIRSSMILHM